MFDKQATEQLKGVAILLVVIGHLFVTQFFPSTGHAVQYLGAQGVAIFLILSGYGLTQSFLQKGIDSSFLVRRVNTVVWPYFLVTLAWIVMDYFQGKVYSLKIVVLSLLGFDFHLTIDATMWYIAFILMWYLVFYLTFRAPLPNPLRVIILFGVAYLFRYHSRFAFTEQVYWQWGLHAFMFPIGVAWAILSSKVDQRHQFTLPMPKWMIYGVAGISLASFLFYVWNVKNNDSGLGPYMLSNFSFAVALIALFLMIRLSRLHEMLEKIRVMQILNFVGSISYEIYLLEAVLMYKFSLLYLLPNKVFALGLYVSGVVLLSLLIQRIVKFNLWGSGKKLVHSVPH